MADNERMTFTEHLGELRDHFVRVAVALLLGFMVAFGFKEELFNFFSAPMKEALAGAGIYSFRAIEITETIFVYLKVSFVAAFFVTLPYTFYQMWSFVAPGLLEKEKQVVTPLIFFSTVFFLLGAYFAYEVIIPFISTYLANLTLENPSVQMDVTAKNAFGVSITMLFAFGMAFELPLVMFFMSMLGLFTAGQYLRFFRYFVVLSLIAGAMLTPPDPISQLLMAGPLNGLYLLGVLAASFTAKKTDGARFITIPSQVWSFLSAALLLLGVGLAAGTWWLGKSHSPLRWIPSNATTVQFINTTAFIGGNADPERRSLLSDSLFSQLKIKDLKKVIESKHPIVTAIGPDDQKIMLFAKGCELTSDPLPQGQCFGDDLAVGDVDWLNDSGKPETSVLSVTSIKELTTAAPAWRWTNNTNPKALKLIPGYQPNMDQTEQLIFSGSLNGDSPWLEIRVSLADSGLVTSLQSRVEMWRAKLQQERASAQNQSKYQKQLNQLIELITELSNLEEQRWSGIKGQLQPPPKDDPSTQKRILLLKKLSNLKATLKPVSVSKAPGQSILDRLGSGTIKTWRTAVYENDLVLRIELTNPAGIDAVLHSLNEATSD